MEQNNPVRFATITWKDGAPMARMANGEEYPIHPSYRTAANHMKEGHRIYFKVQMEHLQYVGESEGCDLPMAVFAIPEQSTVRSLKGGALVAPFYIDTQRIDEDVDTLRQRYEDAVRFREERVFLIARLDNKCGIPEFIKAIKATNFVMDNLFSSDREFGKVMYTDECYMAALVRFDLDRARKNETQAKNYILSKWEEFVRPELELTGAADIKIDGIHVEFSIRVRKPAN